MATFATEWQVDQTAGPVNGWSIGDVVPVVGFDRSESARRALDGAARLLSGHDGQLEVVYVAHLPGLATLSAEAATNPAIVCGFDDLEHQLSEEVRDRLGATEARWHFQRRDGGVAQELIAVADELRRENGPDARIVLVVGGSSHEHHRVVGSVSSKLVRNHRFPVVVIP